MEAKTELTPGKKGARHIVEKLRNWFTLTTPEQTWAAFTRVRSSNKNRHAMPTTLVSWAKLKSRDADVVVICAKATKQGIDTLREVYSISDTIKSVEVWVAQSPLSADPRRVTTALAYRVPR
ncbi:MAG: hypothetical protein EXR76_10120, partial [Myxococcales bacterium]|nr:hypothetical protein [Myxococcales bacterium]